MRSVSAITMENMDNKCNSYHHISGKPYHITAIQIDTLHCQQKELGHKGKSVMHNYMYTLWLAKSMPQDKATLNNEKINLVALCIVYIYACLKASVS